MRARFGGAWIADSEQILPLFKPGRYPVVLERTDSTAQRSYLQR
jgi:hypothetical protein